MGRAKLKSSRKSARSGQGTLEYILLTALVVGVVLVIFNGPLKRFLSSYTSRKSQYTQVVSQQRLGIPLSWFGGNFANPGAGGSGGGVTAGEATAGEVPAADPNAANSGGSASDPNANNPAGANGGATEGGDTSGDGDAGGPGNRGPGSSGGAGNNSLFGSNSRGAGSSNRNGRTTSGEDDEEAATTGGGGGGTVGGGSGVRQDRASGDVQSPADGEGGEEEDSRTTKIKKTEEGGTFDKERTALGSNRERVRGGACDNFDLKVILQIAFVIGLLFLLASVLFQKRGKDD